MNKWVIIIFILVGSIGYINFELINNQKIIIKHYQQRATQSDSAATYYYLKYINCKITK